MVDSAIGILGAGISGLMTYVRSHHLRQSNLGTLTLISQSFFFKALDSGISKSLSPQIASEGRSSTCHERWKLTLYSRIRTEYFDLPESKYQYQEMGAMRIPLTATFPLGNETLTLNFTNHRILFQLAETLNELNKHHESLRIDWIPFIQDSENALSFNENKRNPDGSIPTIGDVAKNSSLGASTLHTPLLDQLNVKLGKIMYDPSMMKLIASNIYEAHKKFLGITADFH